MGKIQFLVLFLPFCIRHSASATQCQVTPPFIIIRTIILFNHVRWHYLHYHHCHHHHHDQLLSPPVHQFVQSVARKQGCHVRYEEKKYNSLQDLALFGNPEWFPVQLIRTSFKEYILSSNLVNFSCKIETNSIKYICTQ